MESSRRHFLQTLSFSGASLLGAAAFPRAFDLPPLPRGRAGKMLILGGTRFLGPHLVEAALRAGWEVTLFNRGKSAPGMFPELETLIGDRKDNLKALEDRSWDVVIDTSGYVPSHVRASAELLAPKVGHYLFISTISVYEDDGTPFAEDHKLLTLEDETVETVDGQTYGPLKALCEQAAEAAMPGRVTVVRPGLIVGPMDNSGRFTYWPWRVSQGGEVLAPGNPEAAVEFIDVRDLAAFCLLCIERDTFGIFNANGPGVPFSMRELLIGCKVVLGSDARFTWLPDEFLLENEVGPWMEMPLWIPGDYPNGATVLDRAHAAGLTHRAAGDTIQATQEWLVTALEHPRTLGRSMKAEKEKAVLQLWHQQSAGE